MPKKSFEPLGMDLLQANEAVRAVYERLCQSYGKATAERYLKVMQKPCRSVSQSHIAKALARKGGF